MDHRFFSNGNLSRSIYSHILFFTYFIKVLFLKFSKYLNLTKLNQLFLFFLTVTSFISFFFAIITFFLISFLLTAKAPVYYEFEKFNLHFKFQLDIEIRNFFFCIFPFLQGCSGRYKGNEFQFFNSYLKYLIMNSTESSCTI